MDATTPGQLSHELPGLAVQGNRILRADTMKPLLLRGINLSGLEYSEPTAAGFLDAAQFSEMEVREIVQGWNGNIIRLPFNQGWCLRGRSGHTAEEYLASIVQMISWAAALGAYTILDLQWLDGETVYGHTPDANGDARESRSADAKHRHSPSLDDTGGTISERTRRAVRPPERTS